MAASVILNCHSVTHLSIVTILYILKNCKQGSVSYAKVTQLSLMHYLYGLIFLNQNTEAVNKDTLEYRSAGIFVLPSSAWDTYEQRDCW